MSRLAQRLVLLPNPLGNPTPTYSVSDVPVTWSVDLDVFRPADAAAPTHEILGNGFGTGDFVVQRFGMQGPNGFIATGSGLRFIEVEYNLAAPSVVPEPALLPLIATAILSLVLLRRRRRRLGSPGTEDVRARLSGAGSNGIRYRYWLDPADLIKLYSMK